jgi:hypothetical protein
MDELAAVVIINGTAISAILTLGIAAESGGLAIAAIVVVAVVGSAALVTVPRC